MEYISFILDLTASKGLRSKYCHCKNPFSFNAMKIEKKIGGHSLIDERGMCSLFIPSYIYSSNTLFNESSNSSAYMSRLM